MNIKLEYGKKGLKVNLPDNNVKVLRSKESPVISSPEEKIKEVLESPLNSLPLSKLVENKKTACIVISDVTRPVPNKVILPVLLNTLMSSGIKKENITILVGTGLHRPNLEEELKAMIGNYVYENFKAINHYARNKEDMEYLGETKRKTPIYINKIFLNADLRIITSLVEPHLMAGYSGGRKAVCPAICGVKTIITNHSPKFIESKDVRAGKMKGNPFHEDLLEVAKKVGVDFSINVTFNSRRELTGIFAGEMESAHKAAIKQCEKQVLVTLPEPADIVITTSAGYPLDLTFYQAIKGYIGALPVVKQGGTIILSAECKEGAGSKEFTELLLKLKNPEEFIEILKKPGFFVIDQWMVEVLAIVRKKAHLMLYSEGLKTWPDENIVTKISSIEESLQKALNKYGKRPSIAVIPEGPYILTDIR